MFKRILSLTIIASMILATLGITVFVAANNAETPQMPDSLINARSGILMEASSGVVLHEFNPHDPMPIASVTKVMSTQSLLSTL